MQSNRAMWAAGLFLAVMLAVPGPRAAAQAPAVERVPVLLDTDLGSDVGDAFALALILASPELELRGVTAVGGNTQQRALMLCRFLTMTGRRHTPVAAGADPQPPRDLGGQYQYYYHPDVLFNRTTRPAKESAVDFLYARLKAQPGKVTIVAAGPLTNVARLLADRPECKPWIRRIIFIDSAPSADAEPNAAADPKAARAVFASGVPLVVVPREAAAGLKLDAVGLKRVFAPHTPLTHQVQTLYQLWDRETPVLADPLGVALCFNNNFCKLEPKRLEVDDRGAIKVGKGEPNAQVAAAVRGEDFVKWYVERLASCVRPAQRPAKLVERGGMPNRVHVAENYDLDIERRWWMAGKAETKNLPPDSKRACRGVLTHDFDDLLGDPKAMWTAVVFNPVPGPPMGKNTRLSFRYFLKGTDTLRVQIYSLTNGYHRHLVLKGLPQGKWESATVDMTQARRPDGTGGPLSEGERIDDIQFYADPTAEIIIDDIVLYDAAAPGEKRPFPDHIQFTAWFDSGKQGKEWPGDFAIVPDKGFFWHAARAVVNPGSGDPWIRLSLRGERPLGAATNLDFRYRLSGADSLRVELVNSKTRQSHVVELKDLKQGEWAQARTAFPDAKKCERVDEIRFLLPKGAELLIDDVLLYTPGK